jgi:hypothetical protein
MTQSDPNPLDEIREVQERGLRLLEKLYAGEMTRDELRREQAALDAQVAELRGNRAKETG